MKSTRLAKKKIKKGSSAKALTKPIRLVDFQKKKRLAGKYKNTQLSVLTRHEGNPILPPHKENHLSLF